MGGGIECDRIAVIVEVTRQLLKTTPSIILLSPTNTSKSTSTHTCSDAGFDVVSGEEACLSMHDPLPPVVVVLLDHIDHRPLVERQLVFLVLLVAVHRHHCGGVVVVVWLLLSCSVIVVVWCGCVV